MLQINTPQIWLLFGIAFAAATFWTGVRPGRAQSTELLFKYPHTSLKGTASAKINIQLEPCRKVCSDRSGCAGFDYSSSDHICRLFSAVGGAEESSLRTAGTRSPVEGYRLPISPPAPPAPKIHDHAKRALEAQVKKPHIEPKKRQRPRSGTPPVGEKPKQEAKRRPPSAEPTADLVAPNTLTPKIKFHSCGGSQGFFQIPASQKCPQGRSRVNENP